MAIEGGAGNQIQQDNFIDPPSYMWSYFLLFYLVRYSFRKPNLMSLGSSLPYHSIYVLQFTLSLANFPLSPHSVHFLSPQNHHLK